MSVPATAASLYLLDTNILIAYVRGGALGRRIESAHGLLVTPRVPLISIVTEGEVRSLARQLNWGAARLQQVDFLLSTFVRVSLDAPGVIEAYARLDAHSRSIGEIMGKNDVWIAATANVTAATRSPRTPTSPTWTAAI